MVYRVAVDSKQHMSLPELLPRRVHVGGIHRVNIRSSFVGTADIADSVHIGLTI
jgi:hypothetical protein